MRKINQSVKSKNYYKAMMNPLIQLLMNKNIKNK